MKSTILETFGSVTLTLDRFIWHTGTIVYQ